MEIIYLKKREDMTTSPKLETAYAQFNQLIQELNDREFFDSTVMAINLKVEEVNNSTKTWKSMRRLIQKKQSEIVRLVEKEHKVVPKNYYRNVWLALGMSAFGVPIGVAVGVSIGNMGMIGFGIPIGMAIGTAVGVRLDKKAQKEGRQLNIELK